MSHHWIYFLPYVLSSPHGRENDTNEGFLSSLHLLGISLHLIQWREAEIIIAEHFITFLREVWSFISSPSNTIPVKTLLRKGWERNWLFAGVMYCMLDAKCRFFYETKWSSLGLLVSKLSQIFSSYSFGEREVDSNLQALKRSLKV